MPVTEMIVEAVRMQDKVGLRRTEEMLQLLAGQTYEEFEALVLNTTKGAGVPCDKQLLKSLLS